MTRTVVMENQEERLRQEILADARKKAERIAVRADAERDRALQQFKQEHEQKRQSHLEEVRQEAARQVRSIQNSIGMEIRRRWLNKREEAINEFFQTVLNQAGECSGKRRQESLCFLAEEALQALSTGAYLVECAKADAALVTEDWLFERAIAVLGDKGRSCAFSVSPRQEISGGLRFQARDGSLSFDNTYRNRLNDLRDALRRRLAEE
jgi:vacuolar-type H+-ATPase subunit E/Vma4